MSNHNQKINKNKKQHLQYQRNLKLNSKNQEFIYYKSFKNIHNTTSNARVSPTFKPYKSKISQRQEQKQLNSFDSNHNKIASLRNQLSIFKPNSNNSIKQKQKTQVNMNGSKNIKNQQECTLKSQNIANLNPSTINNKNISKQLTDIIYDKERTYDDNNNYNQKLQKLTSKLRQIAQNSHLTFKKQKSGNLLTSISRRDNFLQLNNNKKNNFSYNLDNHLKKVVPSHNNNNTQRKQNPNQNTSFSNSNLNLKKSYNYSQELKRIRINQQNNNKKEDQNNFHLYSQTYSLKREKPTNRQRQERTIQKNNICEETSQNRYLVNRSIIEQISGRPRGKTIASGQIASFSHYQLSDSYAKNSKVSINKYIEQSNRSKNNSFSSTKRQNDKKQVDNNCSQHYHYVNKKNINQSIEDVRRSISFNDKNKVIKISDLQPTTLTKNNNFNKHDKNIISKSSLGMCLQAVSKQSKQNAKFSNTIYIKPHNSTINSIIIHSSNKTILTASYDYSVKQTNLHNQNQIFISQIRSHRGRVNVIRTIQDKLWSGGNDCYLRTQSSSWKMTSPIVQIFPEEKDYLNIGTTSTIQRFNFQKRKTVEKIDIRTRFYQLIQKTNKQLYFADNHSLYSIDWRVAPSYKNNLIKNDANFVDQWIPDPFNYQFCKVQDKSLTFFDEKSKGQQRVDLNQNLLSHCWKQSKLYILTQKELLLHEHNRNYNFKVIFENVDQNVCKMEVQNNKCVFGTTQGNLIIKSI